MPTQDWLEMEYQEIGKRYLTMQDFRLKLLGFLPLVSSGLFLLIGKDGTPPQAELLLPIGLFGLFITLGCALFEIRVFRIHAALVHRGRSIESELNVEGMYHIASSSADPSPVGTYFKTRYASAVIYLTTLLAWGYLAFAFRPAT